MAAHGRAIMQAVLEGFAGVAPRSAVPNLIEMLGTLLSRANGLEGGVGGGAPQWMKDILMSVSKGLPTSAYAVSDALFCFVTCPGKLC